MRRTCGLILTLLLILTGCSFSGERIKEPVKFYYLQIDPQESDTGSIIAWEEREAAGHRRNLSYLIALYRMGPIHENLSLPFPSGTAVLMMEQSSNEIKLALGNNADVLSDAEFSLACACLTLTCTELTDVERVTITNGTETITMTKNDILLLDTSMTEPLEEAK